MSDVAPDGSPVAFYRRIPATGEPELIHGTLAPGVAVLDLGSGPGRIAGPLVALGHPVTAVDDGEGMIAALPAGVEGIVGDARTVRLGRRYDCVLLASHLVNDPDDAGAFLATAVAHLTAGGMVIGETYPPGWDPVASVGATRRLGDAEVVLTHAQVTDGLLEAAVRYGVDGEVWTQSFTARLLDEAGLRELLAAVGLRFTGWLPRPGWFAAVRG